MTLMPAQMGMAPVGMGQVMTYGAAPMDGSMGVMQSPMGGTFHQAQTVMAGPPQSQSVQQYVPAYSTQPGGMMEAQQTSQQGGGWGSPEHGSPGPGFSPLGEQQHVGLADYAHGQHRPDPSMGSFGGMAHMGGGGMGGGCACGGGGGSFPPPLGGVPTMGKLGHGTPPPQPMGPPQLMRYDDVA